MGISVIPATQEAGPELHNIETLPQKERREGGREEGKKEGGRKEGRKKETCTQRNLFHLGTQQPNLLPLITQELG
jgi:hypothetical protein